MSNNGTLFLNTLTQTAGTVIPQIVPMFVGNVPGVQLSGEQSTNANDDSSGPSANLENATETVDPNRGAREAKLSEIEARTEQLLEIWKIEEPAAIAPSTVADGSTDGGSNDLITPPRRPGSSTPSVSDAGTDLVTPGRKPPRQEMEDRQTGESHDSTRITVQIEVSGSAEALDTLFGGGLPSSGRSLQPPPAPQPVGAAEPVVAPNPVAEQ